MEKFDERIEMIEKLQINYPHLTEVLKKVKHCHDYSPIAPEPVCMLVTGYQGVGKTTLYESYQQSFPRQETEDGTIVPVLSAVIPAPASVKGVVTALLLALGDPMPDKGSVVQQTIRLRHLLKACQTKIMFLDEFQHVIDRDSTKVLQTTADWLKNLVNQTQIPVILIGMPSCTLILEANPQLRRRFSIRRTLLPFKWTAAGAKTNELQMLLKVIDGLLPLKKPSNLSDPITAYRIYCATGGIMSSIMKLVRGSNRLAIETGQEQITLDILAEVYEEELAAYCPEIVNPFAAPIDNVKPIPIEKLIGMA